MKPCQVEFLTRVRFQANATQYTKFQSNILQYVIIYVYAYENATKKHLIDHVFEIPQVQLQCL